ncbi:hypothetical protein [Burkholderia ubonensis]|uniref:hypothetical protein n=1 Tax=Burkholderia ubonensis TaxID=101571 RepID=UPI001E2C8123|nr:hypothetical protein [Burkholderia ubonensis]
MQRFANPAVQKRYQQLLAALAEQFDGRVMGVNLPETAIDLDTKRDRTGFSCDKYFKATMENLDFARKAFRESYVVQYVNFWPCEWYNDHHYMSRLFSFAEQRDIGLGGPDIVPGKKAQMKNSYPFFHQYRASSHWLRWRFRNRPSPIQIPRPTSYSPTMNLSALQKTILVQI